MSLIFFFNTDWKISDADSEIDESHRKYHIHLNKAKQLFHPLILFPLMLGPICGLIMFKRHYDDNKRRDVHYHDGAAPATITYMFCMITYSILVWEFNLSSFTQKIMQIMGL